MNPTDTLPQEEAARATHAGMSEGGIDLAHWFGVLELPFLIITIIFAFRTARSLRGGVFGKGMGLMAWGFLVMAIGHLHMQLKHFTGFDLFDRFFGDTVGMTLWFVALVTTWLLSGLGFYSIFKASSAS